MEKSKQGEIIACLEDNLDLGFCGSSVGMDSQKLRNMKKIDKGIPRQLPLWYKRKNSDRKTKA